MTNLSGRTAVVTGAGRGIGRAVSRALAGAGARVVLAARSEDQLRQVAGEIGTAAGEALTVACDVSEPASVDNLARRAIERFGAVDILVSNAGVGVSSPLARTSLEDWNLAMSVNATGAFLCTRAFLPGMVERQWGRVVYVASIAGLTGAKYIAAYAASKHAVLGLARSAAAEVAGTGVTVNAVCPSYVDTDMTRRSVDRIVEKTGKSRDEAMAAILTTMPSHRLITAEEVAQAVLKLCGGVANGEAVVIDR